jgi:hypothetical protein
MRQMLSCTFRLSSLTSDLDWPKSSAYVQPILCGPSSHWKHPCSEIFTEGLRWLVARAAEPEQLLFASQASGAGGL